MLGSSLRAHRGATFAAASGLLRFSHRSPDTATTEDIRRFQLHLAEAGVSICNRNRIMTGLRFLEPAAPTVPTPPRFRASALSDASLRAWGRPRHCQRPKICT